MISGKNADSYNGGWIYGRDNDGARESYVLTERGSRWLEASFGSHLI